MKIVGIHMEASGVGWHRCWNWTTALQRMGHEVRHRPFNPIQFDWAEIDNYVRGADVVIAHKMADGRAMAALLLGRDLYKYKLVIDTDDDADSMDKANIAFKDHHAGIGTLRLIRAQYKMADIITVSTPPLRDVVAKYNGHIAIMPNTVDPRIHANIRGRQKEARHTKDIRIYWGGGAGHYADLLMVKDDVLRLFRDDERIKLVFSNFVPAWAADLPPFRVFMIPFAHFNVYARVLKSICADIAIAPLVDTVHNRSKSHVKYLDYAMADVPGVYSDLPPYDSVMDGVTGLKVKSGETWYGQIKRLIQDADLRKSIAVAAKQHVLSDFTVDRWAPRYEAMLRELVAKKPLPLPAALTDGSIVPCPMMSS